jgi:hypothetical protein
MPRSQSAQRIVVLAYILAFAMPPLGVLLAIIIGVRFPPAASRHWPWIILVSVIAGAVWAAIIGSGALSSTSSNY